MRIKLVIRPPTEQRTIGGKDSSVRIVEIALVSDPLYWYGPYRLTEYDAITVERNPRVHVREHECTDPTENGGCGHLEWLDGIEPY